LPELTADDLIGLGVTSIGHRRKLLAAIAALREAAAGAAPAPAAAPWTGREALVMGARRFVPDDSCIGPARAWIEGYT
jgi:hypothetical protein